MCRRVTFDMLLTSPPLSWLLESDVSPKRVWYSYDYIKQLHRTAAKSLFRNMTSWEVILHSHRYYKLDSIQVDIHIRSSQQKVSISKKKMNFHFQRSRQDHQYVSWYPIKKIKSSKCVIYRVGWDKTPPRLRAPPYRKLLPMIFFSAVISLDIINYFWDPMKQDSYDENVYKYFMNVLWG